MNKHQNCECKLSFLSIKNSNIFESDFNNLSGQNGVIKFKQSQMKGGIAVIYAPNGTGKSSFAKLLETETSSEKNSFTALEENGNKIIPETKAFHII